MRTHLLLVCVLTDNATIVWLSAVPGTPPASTAQGLRVALPPFRLEDLEDFTPGDFPFWGQPCNGNSCYIDIFIFVIATLVVKLCLLCALVTWESVSSPLGSVSPE